MEAGRGLSMRLYAALIRLYPPAFRDRFAFKMVQLFGDQLRDARAGSGDGGVVLTWFRGLGDLAVNGIAERLRGDRPGHALEPTPPSIRGLGLFGVIGGVVLLAAFVVDISSELNLVRLILFNVGAMAVALAVHRRQGARAPRLSLAVATAVIVANAWYLAMLLLAIGRPVFPEPDPEFRRIEFYAGAAMWLSDAAFGLVAFRLRAVPRWAGLGLAVGTFFGFLGMGNLELVSGDYGWFFTPLALGGIGLGGIAWVVLGASLMLPRQARVEGPGG
jgi:hypothetical protein